MNDKRIQLTPLTPKADRSDAGVRLFEEAVLRLRGRWPGAATGLCTDVNRLYAFSFGGRAARRRLIENRTEEALRLVDALDGPEAVEEVRRLALHDPEAPVASTAGRPRWRHPLRAGAKAA